MRDRIKKWRDEHLSPDLQKNLTILGVGVLMGTIFGAIPLANRMAKNDVAKAIKETQAHWEPIFMQYFFNHNLSESVLETTSMDGTLRGYNMGPASWLEDGDNKVPEEEIL